MTRQSSFGRLRSRAGRLRDRWTESSGETPDPDPQLLEQDFGDGGADDRGGERPVGHAPDATLEPTNLGPIMDEAVLRAKLRMRIGTDPDYDLLYENFDVLHYLLQSPHLADDPEIDLIEHFLDRGRAEKLDPHPDFGMGEYLARYPQKLARGKVRNPFLYWLKTGKQAGDVAEPTPGLKRIAPVLGLSPQELTDAVAARRRDLQERFRTGRLGEVFARAAQIEPLIGAAWTEIANPHLIPLSRPDVVDEVCALHEAHEAAGFRRARIVFVVNRPRWGAGRRMEGHLAHALAGHVDPSEIVVIYTDDTGDTPAGRFPDGVREIDFVTLARGLPRDRAQRALVTLLRTFHADAIINVNSRLLYRAMRFFGPALAVSERLFLCLFCNEQTATGAWTGWGLSYFYRTFEHVTGVITDSRHLADELVSVYRVPPRDRARLHVLHAPAPTGLPVVPEIPDRGERRPQVFWAGRWDRQKRIPLVLEISRLMPDIDFRMWGEAVLTGGRLGDVPDNVRLEGRYGHLTEIPLADADAWLYTSAWDGVPGQLLEVAVTGIPIVGTLVGGTGEVLGEESWPIPEDAGAANYVAAIRAVLADPADARRRARALRERMLAERTENAFAAQAAALLLPAGDTP